jgi:hypothetical protein
MSLAGTVAARRTRRMPRVAIDPNLARKQDRHLAEEEKLLLAPWDAADFVGHGGVASTMDATAPTDVSSPRCGICTKLTNP